MCIHPNKHTTYTSALPVVTNDVYVCMLSMSREDAEAELRHLVESLVEHFVQPTVHGIKARED